MKNKKYFIFFYVVVLAILSMGLRIYRISEPDHKYFDEVYHVVTAEAYAKGDPAAYDPWAPPPEPDTAFDWLHPPLAKLFQAASINIFGDAPFAWRLPSAIFGTGIVVATFFLGYFLFGSKVAIFASLIVALENLNLVMSRITMNDVFVTFFIIISFIFGYLYLKMGNFKYVLLTSVFLGLAISSKWTGVYAVGAIFIYLVVQRFRMKNFKLKDLLILVIPPIVYLASYGQYWLQGNTWQQFMELNRQIWAYQNRHDLEHPYGTTPIYCVPKGLNGPKTFCPWVLDIKPVYYSYEEYDFGKAGYIYALGNPLIFWFGFISVCYLTFIGLKTPNKKILFLLLGYFIFWVPWIFSPRIMFLSHYLPSIPFMAVLLGLVFEKLERHGYKFVVFSVLALFIFAFFYFYPISTGYPIDIAKIEKFMWLESWR